MTLSNGNARPVILEGRDNFGLACACPIISSMIVEQFAEFARTANIFCIKFDLEYTIMVLRGAKLINCDTIFNKIIQALENNTLIFTK